MFCEHCKRKRPAAEFRPCDRPRRRGGPYCCAMHLPLHKELQNKRKEAQAPLRISTPPCFPRAAPAPRVARMSTHQSVPEAGVPNPEARAESPKEGVPPQAPPAATARTLTSLHPPPCAGPKAPLVTKSGRRPPPPPLPVSAVEKAPPVQNNLRPPGPAGSAAALVTKGAVKRQPVLTHLPLKKSWEPTAKPDNGVRGFSHPPSPKRAKHSVGSPTEEEAGVGNREEDVVVEPCNTAELPKRPSPLEGGGAADGTAEEGDAKEERLARALRSLAHLASSQGGGRLGAACSP